MHIPFQFSKKRIADEFNSPDLNVKIVGQLIDAYCHCIENFKDCWVTVSHIYRTQIQQNEFYKHIPKEDRPKSVHQFWRGLDFQVFHSDGRHFTKAEYKDLENYLNSRWEYFGKAGAKTAMAHSVVGGTHIHLQAGWADASKKEGVQ
jgi:hypothetical protein